MKSLMLSAVLLFSLGLNVNAQDEKPTQYLFGGKGKTSVTGFGAPIIEFSSKGGDLAVSVGGEGAVLFNQSFYFGGYGMGLTTEHKVEDLKIKQSNGVITNYPTMRTIFGHGGLWLGYIHNRKEALHWGISSKFGFGAIGLIDADFDDDSRARVGLDQVFVLTPQIEMEMNINRWFKVNIGAGYRFVSGVDKTYTNSNDKVVNFYKSSDFNSPQASISFLFGGFGR